MATRKAVVVAAVQPVHERRETDMDILVQLLARLGEPTATSGDSKMYVVGTRCFIDLPLEKAHISNSALKRYNDSRGTALPGNLTLGSARFTSGAQSVQVQAYQEAGTVDLANIAALAKDYQNRDKKGAKGGGFFNP